MARVKQEDVAIGHWWAPCCLHDLQRVMTEEDVETAHDLGMYRGAWETCAEAVDELIQECDQEERLSLLRWYRKGNNPDIVRELERYVND